MVSDFMELSLHLQTSSPQNYAYFEQEDQLSYLYFVNIVRGTSNAVIGVKARSAGLVRRCVLVLGNYAYNRPGSA